MFLFKLGAKIQMLFYTTVFGTIVIAGFILYQQYNSTFGVINNKIESTFIQGQDFVSSIAPTKEQSLDLNIHDLKSKVDLQSKLSVAKFTSTSKITINRIGSRDTWIIGGLLEGRATFDYTTKFNGDVKYDFDKLEFVLEGSSLIIILPTPEIYASDVIVKEIGYNEPKPDNNLADIDSERNKALQALINDRNREYFYSQYFTQTEMNKLFEIAAAQGKKTVESNFQKALDLAYPGKFTVTARFSNNPPLGVSTDNGVIEFDKILKADVLGLQTYFKSQDPKITVNVNVQNESLPDQ